MYRPYLPRNFKIKSYNVILYQIISYHINSHLVGYNPLIKRMEKVINNKIVTVGDSHALHGWIDFHSNTNKQTYDGNTGLDLNEQWVDNLFIKSYSLAGTLCYTFNKQDFEGLLRFASNSWPTSLRITFLVP